MLKISQEGSSGKESSFIRRKEERADVSTDAGRGRLHCLTNSGSSDGGEAVPDSRGWRKSKGGSRGDWSGEVS